MSKVTALLMSVILIWSVSSSSALAKQPDPVELPNMTFSISDGEGGTDILRFIALLQPRRAGDGAKIKAKQKVIMDAFETRIMTVKSTQLIPPDGGPAWLERELWDIAERILKFKLDGTIFRELSIE